MLARLEISHYKCVVPSIRILCDVMSWLSVLCHWKTSTSEDQFGRSMVSCKGIEERISAVGIIAYVLSLFPDPRPLWNTLYYGSILWSFIYGSCEAYFTNIVLTWMLWSRLSGIHIFIYLSFRLVLLACCSFILSLLSPVVLSHVT